MLDLVAVLPPSAEVLTLAVDEHAGAIREQRPTRPRHDPTKQRCNSARPRYQQQPRHRPLGSLRLSLHLRLQHLGGVCSWWRRERERRWSSIIEVRWQTHLKWPHDPPRDGGAHAALQERSYQWRVHQIWGLLLVVNKKPKRGRELVVKDGWMERCANVKKWNLEHV